MFKSPHAHWLSRLSIFVIFLSCSIKYHYNSFIRATMAIFNFSVQMFYISLTFEAIYMNNQDSVLRFQTECRWVVCFSSLGLLYMQINKERKCEVPGENLA